MSEQIGRAITTGDLAIFILIAGASPPVGSAVKEFLIHDYGSKSRDEVIRILNSTPKPILCEGRFLEHALHIAIVPITSAAALRARTEYFRLVSGEASLGISPTLSKASDILLKSRDNALLTSADLLKQFYLEYDVPHSSSQNEEDLVVNREFSSVLHVAAAGSGEIQSITSNEDGEGNRREE